MLHDKLSNNAVVILDDAGRKDEQKIVAMWLEEFPDFEHEYLPTKKGISILRRNQANSIKN